MTDLDRALGLDEPPPEEDEETAAQLRLDELRRCVYSADGLAQIPPPVAVVDGWLYGDTLGWLFGQAGACKSYVALDQGGCVANGIDWHGAATKQTPVLYVVLEGAPGLKARVDAWQDYHEREIGIHFLIPRGRRFHIVRDCLALGALAAEVEAGLIYIDTQNRATVGMDEGSSVDMGRMIDALEAVQMGGVNACVTMVHHTAIGGNRPRGHGSIDGAATSMLRVAKDGRLVKVANMKQKDADRGGALLLAATSHAGALVMASGYAADGSGLVASDSETIVRDALANLLGTKPRVNWSDIRRAAQAQGMSESTFGWALRRLLERRVVLREGSAYYLAHPGQGMLGD